MFEPLEVDQILQFERDTASTSGNLEVAVRARFGVSAAAYLQALNRIIDTADALTRDPMLVYQLRARRSALLARRLRTSAPIV